MPLRDVAIAGCGIAGLACGVLLKRRTASVRVVVYDRLKAPQPLGAGLILQPVGLAVLDEIGVGASMRDTGARIERLYGRTVPSGRVVLDVRYDALGRGAARGVAVHRGALFQTLYDAACEAGVEIESGREVVSAQDGKLGFAEGSQSPRFNLVIDALGARSALSPKQGKPLAFGALWASLDWAGGFDPHALEQRYEKARKMVGVLPIGKAPGAATQKAALFWSLKHADVEAWRAAPLEAWKSDVLTLWPETAPLLTQINAHSDLVFAAYAHRTLVSPLSKDIVHLGDSWHCTSPQLGQGANMALLDALALARALETHADLVDALAAYKNARLWHIRLYQAASWMFTPAYQSDSAALAWLRDWIVAPIARVAPAPSVLAALVAGVIGSPLKAMGARKRPHSA